MFTFIITREQRKIIDAWHKKIQKRIIKQDKSKEDPVLKGYVYYGTVGGGLRYIFIPTSIGDIVKVQECITGEELDITEYNKF